jgi:hypothetical protein
MCSRIRLGCGVGLLPIPMLLMIRCCSLIPPVNARSKTGGAVRLVNGCWDEF